MAIMTKCAFFDVVLIFSSLLTTFYFWMKWKHWYWQRRGIRSLPTHWFFGHLKDAILMRKPAGVILAELHQQANDDDEVLGIYVLHKPFLLIRNPELIKQIMIKDFHAFSNHHFTAKTNADSVSKWCLGFVDNPEWKYLRMKMTSVFTSSKLKNLFLLMQESGEAMRDHLHDRFTNVSEVSFNVQDTFYRYTTNVISSVAFGIRTNCFDTPTPEFYKKSRDAFRITLLGSLRFFFLYFLPNIGKYMGGKMLGDSTDYFRKVFWDSMDSRSLTKTKRGDLIDSLLQLKAEPDNVPFQFEGDALFAQAAIFFVAGRDTSISTMTYVLCELAKHPEIQKRVRQEILEKIKAANGLTYDAVRNMKYLHQVINETLRLYPPAPILDRLTVTEYTFPGTKITIEKGTPVYVSVRGLHTDPRYYADPARFDPERFSDEKKNEITPCTFVPFGEGPRNCIGRYAIRIFANCHGTNSNSA
ncbi:cytochrome P450 6k1-like isoform X2 [Pseudomyrmex gracilis]|uniref:cytochrome P450 6k1-like isoform X2 n=1 Tax=Pseudomyrmex gracilis TaxID=219809 RepID=UPI000994D4E7|nr:cytochrome P450 6k1-like isoform X2 [Pseudomyrmex gracilis]